MFADYFQQTFGGLVNTSNKSAKIRKIRVYPRLIFVLIFSSRFRFTYSHGNPCAFA